VVVHQDELVFEVSVQVLASLYQKDYYLLHVVADVALQFQKDYFHQDAQLVALAY
jgi:hypothetical protein